MFEHDVIIIGGGLAGSRAALEIVRTNPTLNVGLIAKTHPIRSHSVAAQGGMAASLQNADPTDSTPSIRSKVLIISPTKTRLKFSPVKRPTW